MEITTMFSKKRRCRYGVCIVALLFCTTLLSTVLQAQTTTGVAVDPGPRPTGNVTIFPCPGLKPAKYPTMAPCTDIGQPAAPTGAPPADGAGNVVSGAGNLVGTWFWALEVFSTDAVVSGPRTGGSNVPGLGPSFNATSCFECHSQPTIGGSSPNTQTVGFPNGNPQVGDATEGGAINSIPSFITPNGPVREARFINAVPASGFAAAVPAGAVAELFVIQGRTDMPAGCQIDQEDFQAQQVAGNVSLRIPIPLFGEGFVEATPEKTLRDNLAHSIALASSHSISGIAGSFNTNGNDGTITRFGWKAQNKSLLLFAGEAANVELGVTNELFPNEKTTGNGSCTPNPLPEDQTVALPAPSDPRTILTFNNDTNLGPDALASDTASFIENAAIFMRLNGAPSQCNFNSGVTRNANGTLSANCLTLDASAKRGQTLFGTVVGTTPNVGIGCVLCHSDQLTTGPAESPGLSNQKFHPFSDFALHHMGGLADGVTQGAAGPDQFRTAPLWGLGQRLFFLHDGGTRHPNSTTLLRDAIEDHCIAPTSTTLPASEACAVIQKFNALPELSGTTNTPSKQDLLNFLRSL